LENWIQFIFVKKIGNDEKNIPGCAFFSAANQAGCGEEKITDALVTMSERSAKYNLALVNALKNGGYLQEGINSEIVARLMQQYVHGAISCARVTRNISNIRRELPEGIYRIIGLKPEHWFTAKPNWQPEEVVISKLQLA
jgi:TetR/AcrR family transcriptional repressor of nem operon